MKTDNRSSDRRTEKTKHNKKFIPTQKKILFGKNGRNQHTSRPTTEAGEEKRREKKKKYYII